jgi:formylglycine-generating enzyme required for sulfatase activity
MAIFLIYSCEADKIIKSVQNETYSCTSKDIVSFLFTKEKNSEVLYLDIAGLVSETTVDITVPYGTDISSLVPTIVITGVSVNPSSGMPKSFTDGAGVTYTVTAEDNSTKDYTVTVNIALNTDKDITSFIFETTNNPLLLTNVVGVIGANTIDVTVPYGTGISSLIPTIVITGLSVNPNSGISQDFTSPVLYTVNAEDGSTKDYTISLNIAPIQAGNLENYVAGVSFNMIYVPSKSFKTGMDDSGTAEVITGYFIGETEVTYELWNTVYTWATSNGYTFANTGVMGDGTDDTNQHPVTTINWRDAMVWTNALTEYYNYLNGTSLSYAYYSNLSFTIPIKDSSDGAFGISTDPNPGGFDDPFFKCDAGGFRLLSSDEWELAARYIDDMNNDGDIEDNGEYYPGNYASGATADYNNANETGLVAVYSANSGSSTAVVKSKLANALGIYDMSGNVGEWAFNWSTPLTMRMLHGGHWSLTAFGMQVASVDNLMPYSESNRQGFRLARGVE